MSEWTERAAVLADAIARNGPEPDLREQLVATLRAVANEAELSELMLEARLEELAIVREMLSALSYPVLEVQASVLCLPIVGPVDAAIMEQVTEDAMHTASRRRARWLIVDLTGAQFGDVVAVDGLRRLFRALGLIGLRAAISGVSPALAQSLAALDTPLDIPVYASLATALAATATKSELQ